jgi:hypothetical protein
LSINEFIKVISNQQIAVNFERILNKKKLNIKKLFSTYDSNRSFTNNTNKNESSLIPSIESDLRKGNQLEHQNQSPVNVSSIDSKFAHEISTTYSTTTTINKSLTVPANRLPSVGLFQSVSFANETRSSNVQNPNNYRRHDNSRSNKRLKVHEEFMRKENELFQKAAIDHSQ